VIVFVGSGMLHKEIDKRTVTVLLARPLSRRAYVAGKFAGLSLTLLCLLAVMAAVFVAVALAIRVPLHAGYAIALYMALLELLVITAAVVFLSTFASPVLSAVFAVALFVIGHLSADLRAFGEVVGGAGLRAATRVLFFALPDLEMFNVRGAVVYGDPIAAAQVLRASVYGLALTALLLVLAGAVFARKELK
jgi:Cu-processing system permease protein